MRSFPRVILQKLGPDGFFRLEVVHRISSQFIKNSMQLDRPGLMRQVTGQQVKQFNQLLMLVINPSYARFKITIPRKYLNVVH